MSDPIKQYREAAALDAYKSLRSANPHLPLPEMVTVDEVTITMGTNMIPKVSLSVFITLPDAWTAVPE